MLYMSSDVYMFTYFQKVNINTKWSVFFKMLYIFPFFRR